MATMFKDVSGQGTAAVNLDALKSEVRAALINQKVNACPITMRHAWHMSGTFDKNNGTGGSDGATVRFAPEKDDGANAGLHIIRDLLLPVKRNHPEVSYADLYVIASAMAIEFTGGPEVPVNLGRSDEADGAKCPENGRLPDASQGAAHLRDVFGRMGFNDQEIVALSGGHTLGSCHRVRSGFDGQWTSRPLKFDNEYFTNLLTKEWKVREWEGPRQFQDKDGKLMMLPTDIALLEDASFRSHVERYAASAEAFNKEFAAAYGKLVALGCPAHCQPGALKVEGEKDNAQFRHFAMHGSVAPLKEVQDRVDVHSVDPASGRGALHFAAFWGHIDMAKHLVDNLKLNLSTQDFAGDTPLHDAASHGHEAVAAFLVASGADVTIRNKAGLTPAAVAQRAEYPAVRAVITKGITSPAATAASKLSTHVLDTANGCPAANMKIDLFSVGPKGEYELIKTVMTNQDGRAVGGPLLQGAELLGQQYELCFHVGDYFASKKGTNLPAPPSGVKFLDVVPIRFGIPDASQGYHVPLLCSPWSFSTYRGS